MASEIELVSDDEGVVVAGGADTVQRFLDQAGLLAHATAVDLSRIREVIRAGASVAETASGVLEQSALYIKLTPESAKLLKDAGGLMPTKTRGISHVMLGETGKKSMKWLQSQDGPASLLSNPAVLSGVGGLLSQAAQQTEAQELRALLLRIDEKLDDARRERRDRELAKLRSVTAALGEAQILRRSGGDPKAAWDKVSHLAEAINDVQETALGQLQRLAEKVQVKESASALRRALRDVQGEVALQLAMLARCFELQDEFRVVELDYVLETSSSRVEGHRRGLHEAREERRATVLGRTSTLMGQLDAAADTANGNAILHAGAARFVVDVLNATGALVADFHAALGIETQRETVTAITWQDALRDPRQRRTAGREIGEKAVLVAASAGAVASVAVVAKKGTEGEDPE
ncbi:hypothetical protein [Ornithinimicrobium cerasi]|uniref:Uncharacterized protein n=1 Tax=Ornithinimicrobium cerasi TaxID=2248773 RepID=A0A285VAZ9_9MICO|nr:hypothetical protein [Ornithinimicrobium cerasi]SOC51147.1 hypothetical protein SAMN05421879_10148 [Ornithinimicrobium cerasi]